MSKEAVMGERSNIFNRFANLLDKDIKGVHIGCYSVALFGLTMALRKVRPFSKFKYPKDIPNQFIKDRRELTGLVRRVDPNGALLMVEHKPLVNIPLMRTGLLPVKISGVDVSGLGLSWLQAIVAGQEVRFVPLVKDNNWVQCQVLLVQRRKNSKEEILNVGEHLVMIGFGQTTPVQLPLSQNQWFLNYYKRLQAAENFALRKKLGLKYYIKPTKVVLGQLYHKLGDLSRKLTVTTKKQIRNVPQLITA